MAQTLNLTKTPALRYHYNGNDDVLYVSWSPESTTHGQEFGSNVILRLNDQRRVLGVTVYDVRRRFDFNPQADLLPQVSALAASILSDYAISGR
jgi:uncharacterized protein YuzE